MTAIIILNWNGADDTIACLRSLEKAQGDFFVTVADNGSTDDSVRRINDYVSDYPREIHILEHGKNYGFAAGNNKAIAYASQFNPDAYLLLNNDTEVTPDFLTILEEFRRKNPACRVLTPRINFYYDKQRIWNCGGRLFMGFRKYLFAGDKEEKAVKRRYYRISFVTGCALYFTPDVLTDDGRLLTERFFFGEEDFEFSIRMRKAGVRMACVTDSVIYHKVGASSEGKNQPGRIYQHLLNRYIDIRLNYGKVFYLFWRLLNKPVSFRHLRNRYGSASEAIRKLRRLEKDSKRKDCVTEDDFNRLVVKGDYFDETVL